MLKVSLVFAAVAVAMIVAMQAVSDKATTTVPNVTGVICSKCGYPSPVESLQFYFTCRNNKCRHRQIVSKYVPEVGDPPTD